MAGCTLLCFQSNHRFAEAASGGDDYFILLIITDGIITDMEQTKDAIVNVRYPGLLSWIMTLYMFGAGA